MAILQSTRLCATLGLLSVLAGCGGSIAAANPDGGPGPGTGTAPLVTSTNPSTDALGVAINVKLGATFSVPMDPSTLTASTFTVSQGGAAVSGVVVYSGSTAVFTPAANLAISSSFTATITTGARDLAGNALAAPYSWTFVTGTTAARGPASVGLGSAGNFAVIAKTAISSVPSSVISGDLGVSPAAASFVTGFSLIADASNVFATSTQVVGKIYAANYAVPSPSKLTTAISNMESAYTDAAGRPNPEYLELGTGSIGGLTLAPGLYKWTSTVTIPTNVTLAGGSNDVWVFQTTGDLAMTAAMSVILSGGALAKNVYWQVAGQVTLGANSHFEGIILCQTQVTLETGATMNGRILAQSQVALQQATITQPAQ